MFSYLRDLFVVTSARGHRLVWINLVLIGAYIYLRMEWPASAEAGIIGPLALCFTLTIIFALNIRLMLIAALPKIHHGMEVRDEYGQLMVIDEQFQQTTKSFPLIVVTYISTLAFGFLFLTELMQLSASLDWIACAPSSCDSDRLALASRVVSGTLNGDLHVTAKNTFGLIVLLMNSIINIVLLTLLIPALLAFRD